MLLIRQRLASLTADLPPAYWLLWLGTVINRLGGFVIPFLSLYLTSERGITVAQAGLIVSLFGAGSFVAHLAGGELADRLGRRPVLLLSLLGTPPLMAALGFARHLVVISILTALVGFFTELYRPAVGAAIADLVAPSARTRAYGYMYWAINVGAALAPIAAGFLAHLDYLLLFVGDAITTLIYGLIVLWRIRETQPADAQREAHAPMQSRLRQLASEPILLVMTGLTLIFGLVYMQGFVTLPLDMQNHGLGPSDYGLAAAANGILVVLITIQLSRAVAKWPHFGVLALAALLTGVGFGMNAWATTLPAYILAVGVWTLGEILVNAVAPTIIAELSPVQLRGLYQGIFGSAWGLAFFVGPLLGGWVFGSFSPDVLWIGCAVLGGFVAVGFLALSGASRRRMARGHEGGAAA